MSDRRTLPSHVLSGALGNGFKHFDPNRGLSGYGECVIDWKQISFNQRTFVVLAICINKHVNLRQTVYRTRTLS